MMLHHAIHSQDFPIIRTGLIRFRLFAFCFFVIGSVMYGASLSEIPSPDCWITNGIVRAIVQREDTIYFGGQFSYVGPFTGAAVCIDSDTGEVVNNLARIDGKVYATVSDGNGGWFVAGLFDKVGSTTRNNIAHILPDGSLDLNWEANTDGAVNALATDGNVLYVGGAFTVVDGENRSNIAAVDFTTGNVASWNADADKEVLTLALSGSTLYAGGKFALVKGLTRNRIAALETTTGTPSSWDANANGDVWTILVNGSTVYAGGDFTVIKTQNRNRLAALSASTAVPTAFNPNIAGGIVRTLTLSGSTLYMGGTFTTIGGTVRNRLGAVDATSGSRLTWNPNASGAVNSLAVSGAVVYAGGLFTTIGGQERNYLAGIDTVTSVPTAWSPNAQGEVKSLSYTADGISVGGTFYSVGGVKRNNIAAIDAVTGRATDWNPNASAQIAAMEIDGSQLYVGGNFANIGGENRNRIASLDPDTGLANTWNPNANNNVECITSDGSLLYVGGGFTSIGGQTRNRVAAIEKMTGAATVWNPNCASLVRALAVGDDNVFIGGTFTTAGGQPRSRMAKVDKNTGALDPWEVDCNNSVTSLVLDGADLYVGGQFTYINLVSRSYLGCIDAETAALDEWNPSPSGPSAIIQGLSLRDSTLHVAGKFTSIDSQAYSGAAAFDAETKALSGWNPSFDNQAVAISPSSARVVVGGQFTHAATPAYYLAVYEMEYGVNFITDGTLDASLSGDLTQSVRYGKQTSAVTAVAPVGWRFVRWTRGGMEISTANPLSITVDQDMTLQAEFETDTVSLKYAAGDHGHVSGDLDQSVSCGGNGTAVEAIPDTGYEFFQWSDGSEDNPRQDMNVAEDLDVTALFVPASYTLTYLAGTGGTIQGVAAQNVLHGENGSEVLAVPGTGHDFLKWSDESTANPRQDLNVTNDISVTAIFSPKTYVLTYTAGSGGAVSGLLTQNVDHGTNGSSVTALPNVGFEFVRWSDNSTQNPRIDENVTGALSVEAIFAIKQYNVTYLAGENGSIQGNLNQVVNHGGSGSVVTAVPAANYEFWKWSDESSANPRQEVDVKAPVSVTALFRLKRYMLNYTAGIGGSISGFASQEVLHGANGSSVSAVPNIGFEFVRWSDDSLDNPRVDMNVIGPISVEAIFAIKKYNLTYSAGANGTVQGNLNQEVNHGGTGSAVTAVPADGYVFVEWSDGRIDNPRADSPVNGNVNVIASFAQNVFQLTYHAGPNGRIEGTATQNVAEGGDGDTVTAVPDAGYHFVQWSDAFNNSVRTDGNVVTNIDVTAYFAINEYTVTFQTDGLTGATIFGDLSQTVAHGGDCQSVSAVAPAHCRFVKWTLNGVDYSDENPLVVCGVSGNMTLVAVFSSDTAIDVDWERYR